MENEEKNARGYQEANCSQCKQSINYFALKYVMDVEHHGMGWLCMSCYNQTPPHIKEVTSELLPHMLVSIHYN